MTLPMPPLDEAERYELARFLLYRGETDPGETYVEGRDEGIVTLSALNGFFTAIVSGPAEVAPSRWLSAVWGDVEPVWLSAHAFERVFTLFSRYMNGIATALLYPDPKFVPLFTESELEGKRYTLVHEWCMGYMRGIRLAPELWECGGDEMLGLLMPIDIFTNEWGGRLLANLNEQEHAVLKQEIGPAARAIHNYWQARRLQQ
ncbi:MAG TPA: UPF0149 family protein [Gammaproteobacteria bacterium]